jgi:hypothetical protein
MEVAWNMVQLRDFHYSHRELKGLYDGIHPLKSLRHCIGAGGARHHQGVTLFSDFFLFYNS